MIKTRSIPYKCPICEGEDDNCKACGGKGIVWGSETEASDSITIKPEDVKITPYIPYEPYLLPTIDLYKLVQPWIPDLWYGNSFIWCDNTKVGSCLYPNFGF